MSERLSLLRTSLSLLALVGLLLGQPGADTTGHESFTPTKEINRNRPILNASFSFTGKGTQPVFYPNIVWFTNGLSFLDSTLNPVKSISLDSGLQPSVIFSPSGKYIAVHTSRPRVNPPTILSKLGGPDTEVLTIYDRRGDSLSTFQVLGARGPDRPDLTFYVSDNDHLVSASYAANQLIFYDGKGRVRSKREMFASSGQSLVSGGEAVFSGDGRCLLVVAASDTTAQWADYIAQEPILYAILYDNNGRELWRRPLDGNQTSRAFAISARGSYVCAGGERTKSWPTTKATCNLFDAKGRLVGTYDVLDTLCPYAPFCCFSPDEKYLALANANVLLLIETASGKVVWRHTFPWRFVLHSDHYGYIAGIELSNDASVIGVGSVIVDRTPAMQVSHRLDILDRQGDALLENFTTKPDNIAKWNANTSTVFVSPDGSEASFRTRTGFQIFEHPRL
jgi:hypothetical protein